jgi:hypothetical protein
MTLRLDREPGPMQDRNARNQKDRNWDAIEKDSLAKDQAHNALKKQFNDEIVNITLKDPSSAEIVAGRTNSETGDSYGTIGQRLDEGDRKTSNLISSIKTDRSIDNLLGICFHSLDEDLAGKLVEYGFKYGRIDASWSTIESAKGAYDFSSIDPAVSAMISAGIQPTIILGYNNPNYLNNVGGQTIITDAQREAFSNFAAAIVDHFNDHHLIWEIYNEPNTGNWSAWQYCKLLQAVYPVIKEHDPDATVIAPAFSGGANLWFDEAFRHGIDRYCDALSVHFYTADAPDESYRQFLLTFKSILASDLTHNMPIYVTEHGYSTVPVWDGSGNTAVTTEDDRLKYIKRSILLSIAFGVDKIFIYEAVATKESSADVEDWFGIFDSSYTSTPTAEAIKSLYSSLVGYKLVDYEIPSSGTGNDFILTFYNGRQTKRAVWTTGDSHEVFGIMASDNPQIIETNDGWNTKIKPMSNRFNLNIILESLRTINVVYNSLIFNNPKDNVAFYKDSMVCGNNNGAGRMSFASGTSNLAYPGQAYLIKSVDPDNNKVVLEKTTGLSAGVMVGIKRDYAGPISTFILSIDSNNNAVTVSDKPDSSWTCLAYGAGDYYGASSEGANNMAVVAEHMPRE